MLVLFDFRDNMQESSISMPSTSTSPRSSLAVKNEALQNQDQLRLIQGKKHFSKVFLIKIAIKTIFQPGYFHLKLYINFIVID